MLPALPPSTPSPSSARVPSVVNEVVAADPALVTSSGVHDQTAVPSPQAPQAPQAPPPAAKRAAEVWGIDFSPPHPKRKTTKKEREALAEAQARQLARECGVTASAGADSEGNTVHSAAPDGRDSSTTTMNNAGATAPMAMVRLDGLADEAALIPRALTTTRADLEARFVLRLPRLLCVNKQYPRSCGVSSLTSVYNYLYSRIGESAVGQSRPPISQEEVMSILGFAPPFGEIRWGPFTGNATLIRWFHALNAHFGLHGKASILYKEHGSGKTTHLYESPDEALMAVKAALRDPHCAIIYHCHNHYMVPVGYQEIPRAQTDFFSPNVSTTDCDTTIFIGEVSRGRHEAMYARRWAEIVQDLQCASPYFFNIRHPELGIQKKGPAEKAAVVAAGPAPTNTAASDTEPLGTIESTAVTASLAHDGDGEADTHHITPATPPVDVQPPQTASRVARATAKTAKAGAREPNNLHCLILFRNDVAEEHPEVYARRRDDKNEEGQDDAGPLAADELANSRSSSDSTNSDEADH